METRLYGKIVSLFLDIQVISTTPIKLSLDLITFSQVVSLKPGLTKDLEYSIKILISIKHVLSFIFMVLFLWFMVDFYA